MSPLVTQLVYASAAERPFSDLELRELLRRARERNQALGVTGILLYDAGSFLQILEGDEQVVSDLFDRIRVDPRHGAVTPLLKQQVATREFANWSMGFVAASGAELSALPGYSDLLKHGKTDVSRVASAVRSMILAFRDGRLRRYVQG